MRSPGAWILFIGLIAGIFAIRPAGELILRSEVQRRTGSRLSMDRCHFNMLTGGLAIQGAVIEVASGRQQDQANQQKPIKIATIWSKGSLNRLLYKKISAPVTVMDGMVLEVSKQDENQVPAVQPVTQLARDNSSLLVPQPNLTFDELDQAFLRTKEAVDQNRLAYDQIESQLRGIEGRAFRFDNPLRDQEALLAAQKSVASLKQDLIRVRDSLERNREFFRQSSLSITPSIQENVAIEASVKPSSKEEETANMELQARSLAEHMICAAIVRMRPYVGLSASLTRQCLIDTSRCESQSSFRSGPRHSNTARGVNYQFGSINESDILFGSVRLRGEAVLDERGVPFSGHMKNIGSQSLRSEERPSLNLTFATQDGQNFHETPSVVVKSTIIPDRQGFKIQCQMIPEGSMIASTAQGDWKLAAFGQDSTIMLEWIVHQSEWSMTIDIRGSQSEVVVKRNALLSMPVQSAMMPRYESCFESADAISLAKGFFQGDIREGIAHQRSLRLESPFLGGLVESMLEQQRMLMDIGSTNDRQAIDAAFAESQSRYQSQIDRMCRELVSTHEQLHVRLRSSESSIAAALPNRDDLRFSRDRVETIQR